VDFLISDALAQGAGGAGGSPFPSLIMLVVLFVRPDGLVVQTFRKKV